MRRSISRRRASSTWTRSCAPLASTSPPRAAGAYLAEVVIRRAPITLRWVEATVLPGGAGPHDPFVLATPKNLVVMVLGKARRRATNENDDTLMKFATAVQDLCSREATSVS